MSKVKPVNKLWFWSFTVLFLLLAFVVWPAWAYVDTPHKGGPSAASTGEAANSMVEFLIIFGLVSIGLYGCVFGLKRILYRFWKEETYPPAEREGNKISDLLPIIMISGIVNVNETIRAAGLPWAIPLYLLVITLSIYLLRKESRLINKKETATHV